MTSKLLHEAGGLRTFALVFETGDSVVEGLQRFGREQQVRAAQFTAIGAFSRVTVGYFEWERKEYQRIRFDEQVEVLVLAGNFGMNGGESALHAHVVLGRADGSACGGHLLDATVRPTLEVIVIETPQHLQRRVDQMTGLALITM
jgi:predicted DNA-binding protein with PD1-like motif